MCIILIGYKRIVDMIIAFVWINIWWSTYPTWYNLNWVDELDWRVSLRVWPLVSHQKVRSSNSLIAIDWGYYVDWFLYWSLHDLTLVPSLKPSAHVEGFLYVKNKNRETERLSPRNDITVGDIELDMVDLFYFYDSLSAFCLNSNPHERCI